MPSKRSRQPLVLRPEDARTLQKISQSRMEPFARVKRARILIAYAEGEAIATIARKQNTDRPVIERCVDKTLSGGIETALKDLARPGRPAVVNAEDKAWVVHLACGKPSDYGLAADRWTISQLAQYIRAHAIEQGRPTLARTGKSAVHNILQEAQIQPHKTAYYLQRRDEQFEEKMAQVLFIYKEIQEGIPAGQEEKQATISYDEKPGIQAISNVAPDLAPIPGVHACWMRDHEYKRHGTVSLLAGIDLRDGNILGLVRDRHRSKEFIEFLELADGHYPEDWKVRIILDNHSEHIPKETMRWLKTKPNRFEFVYTPKHGSWLNIIEVFFSKMSRAFLRSRRVSSKSELKQRIEQYLQEVNASPVVFRWKYNHRTSSASCHQQKVNAYTCYDFFKSI